IFEPEASRLKDLGIELTPIVHDDQDRAAVREARYGVSQCGNHSVDVAGELGLARPPGGAAELLRAQLLETQQLVRVAVLLVVVDQPWIRRRGEERVEGAGLRERA